jgi:Holliday junction DNA helicase RuvA
MIALLRGAVASVHGDALVLDVNGVGYLVHAPGRVLRDARAGQERTLHISTIVREDAFLLYGFDSIGDRDAFDVLRGVNKIGPKHALAVLSTMSRDELARAVAAEDLTTLSRVPGVGRKTASRMVLDLKGKLPSAFSADPAASAAVVAPAPAAAADPLVLALGRLDYRKSEIDRAVAGVPGPDDAPLDQRLRAALRVLSPGA